ncbi:hypothetical protein [Kordia sp.]|uniref:hypothetical protein n=1 Tax=Kordia sp. TaxID=1965332 RepID=UPI003D6A7F11
MKKRKSVNNLELRKGTVSNFNEVKGGLDSIGGPSVDVCTSKFPLCPKEDKKR